MRWIESNEAVSSYLKPDGVDRGETVLLTHFFVHAVICVRGSGKVLRLKARKRLRAVHLCTRENFALTSFIMLVVFEL